MIEPSFIDGAVVHAVAGSLIAFSTGLVAGAFLASIALCCCMA